MAQFIILRVILSLVIVFQLPIGTEMARLSSSLGTSTSNIEAVLRHHRRIVLDEIQDEALLNPSSASDTVPVHLKVEAFGRVFKVSLRKGRSVYTPDARIVVHDVEGKTELEAAEFGTDSVEGYLANDPENTYVHGHVIEGAFDGIIETPEENYYIEPAYKFFEDVDDMEAVIYRESDVKRCPNDELGMSHSEITSLCPSGLKSLVEFEEPSLLMNGLIQRGLGWMSNTTTTNHKNDSLIVEESGVRIGQVCRIKVVADHTLFQSLARGNVRKAVGHMEFHVRETDRMYQVTDFNFDKKPDNIRIRIAKVDIFKTKTTKGYLLADEKLKATTMLSLFTKYNHDGFCAAMLFTHRIVESNVLGFAYRGGKKHAGGICYPRKKLNGELKSMNVGFVTDRADFGRLTMARSTVVVAHELGHMFGSQHDEDQDKGACFHPDQKRHYIMSAMANPGSAGVNRKFSVCSRRAIAENLKIHGNCLVCKGADCGNGVSIIKKTVTLTFLLVWQLALFMII